MADRAYITTKVFIWARESAKMSEDIAASKAAVSVEKFREWETGDNYPTIRQAQNLAKSYRRPFALFFLPEIPNDFHPLQDFRKKGSKELSTSSIFIIREIQQKQAWISEVNEDSGEEVIPFVGRYSISDSPLDVAKDILKTLVINPLSYNSNNPILDWIKKAESNGIFISRTSFIHSRLKLDSNELQGFAIADNYAPFIFINSDDWNAPQLFTLVHELAHIWIAETGISSDIEPTLKESKDYSPIELFCNNVAANALMPLDYMHHLDTSVFANARYLFKSAKQIGVSSFALLVRALNLNLISLKTYNNLKVQADIEFKKFLIREDERKENQKKSAKDSPIYYPLIINRNGRLFTQTVLDAFRVGFIQPTQASNLLNVKVNNFSKLEAQMYRWL